MISPGGIASVVAGAGGAVTSHPTGRPTRRNSPAYQLRVLRVLARLGPSLLRGATRASTLLHDRNHDIRAAASDLVIWRRIGAQTPERSHDAAGLTSIETAVCIPIRCRSTDRRTRSRVPQSSGRLWQRDLRQCRSGCADRRPVCQGQPHRPRRRQQGCPRQRQPLHGQGRPQRRRRRVRRRGRHDFGEPRGRDRSMGRKKGFTGRTRTDQVGRRGHIVDVAKAQPARVARLPLGPDAAQGRHRRDLDQQRTEMALIAKLRFAQGGGKLDCRGFPDTMTVAPVP
jgi:hypothetical protein